MMKPLKGKVVFMHLLLYTVREDKFQIVLEEPIYMVPLALFSTCFITAWNLQDSYHQTTISSPSLSQVSVQISISYPWTKSTTSVSHRSICFNFIEHLCDKNSVTLKKIYNMYICIANFRETDKICRNNAFLNFCTFYFANMK